MSNKNDQNVSLHEAAHVVDSIVFEHSFKYVTIKPNETSAGHVLPIISSKVKKALDIGKESAQIYQYVKEEMIILLVAQAAEARLLKIPFQHRGSQSDMEQISGFIIRLYPEKKVYKAYFNYILEEARSFVLNPRNWKAIKAIAKELDIKKTLSKKECISIYRSSIFQKELLEKKNYN